MLGDHYYRFTKYCLYESSVRVPLVLSGSALDRSKVGCIDDRPAELVDVLPTLLDVAGIDQPEHLAGASLLGEPRRTGSFCEYHASSDATSGPSYMWRTPDAKLITYADDDSPSSTVPPVGHGEFYDLREDPAEWHNRYDDPATQPQRNGMMRDLLGHLAQTWKRYPRRGHN
jgi:arylsulfatase